MTASETPQRFALPARLLHWTVAAAMPIQIYLGWAAEWETERIESFRLIRSHYQLGIVIFGLMLLRVLWRVGYGAPLRLQAQRRWQSLVAATVHGLLYALLLTMPVSGYVIWVWMDGPMDILGVVHLPRLFTPPVDDETGRALAWYIHYYSSWAVIALVALHIIAALWHQYVRRDNLIATRML
jgi:cytochrome b561